MTTRIALIGSRTLAARLVHVIETTGFGAVVGVFDDFEPRGALRHGKPVLGALAQVPEAYAAGAFDAALMAIGYAHRDLRAEAFARLRAAGIPFATVIHPSALVDPTAAIGAGSVVLANCTIDMNARLGENVFLSSCCFVSHDVAVGDHTYCAPAVALAGETRVGARCFLGIGTITIDGTVVGDGAQSAAGAVLTREVPAGALVAGVPAVVKRIGDPPA